MTLQEKEKRQFQLEAYSEKYTNAYQNEENKIKALDHIIKQYDFLNVLSLKEDVYNKKILSQESEKLIIEALLNNEKHNKIISEANNNDEIEIYFSEMKRNVFYRDYSKLINEPLKYDTICFWENEDEKINFIANCLFEIERAIKNAVYFVIDKHIQETSPYYNNLFIKNKTIGKITNPIKTYLKDKNFDYTEYKNELDLFYLELNETSVIDKYNQEQKEKHNIIISELEKEVVAKKEDPKKEKIRKQHKYIVGLLIAKGKLNQYWNTEKNTIKKPYSRTTITKDLKLAGMEKVIYESLSNTGEKNLFIDLKIMELIIEDCNTLNIDIDPNFHKRYVTHLNNIK